MKPILTPLALLAALALAGCGALRGTPVPTPTPAIVPISADQAAQAMTNDEFFSDYRNDILQVTGTVSAVRQVNGQTVVELQTSIPRIVRCYLDNPSSAPAAGATVTLQAASADGQREDDAVGLLHCSVIRK